MKKLCLSLLIMCGLAFADQCDKGAQTVVAKLKQHNRSSVTLNYSSDQKSKKDACIAAIKKLNASITVNENLVSGTDKFKFSK